jgi:hypothetical protein
MRSNRGRVLTISGSKFNQPEIRIIGLRLDAQSRRLLVRSLAWHQKDLFTERRGGHAEHEGITEWACRLWCASGAVRMSFSAVLLQRLHHRDTRHHWIAAMLADPISVPSLHVAPCLAGRFRILR